MYIQYLDLSKAFDSVDRDLLWAVLRQCGCPVRYTQLHGGELSEPFEVSRGVKLLAASIGGD